MPARKGQPNRWTQRVMQTSNALDLEPSVFMKDDPRSIARSLKRSAEQSKRRKSEPFRSAMSMLNFYINRAGKNLPKERRERLEAAKDELRDLYGRPRQDQSRNQARPGKKPKARRNERQG
jgi:hypothetical protein